MTISFQSMIIRDFNTGRAGFDPDKADTIMAVDSNAVLSRSIFHQSFQPVAGRNLQLRQHPNRIKLIQLSRGDFPQQPAADFPGFFRVPAVEDILRAPVF